MDNQPAPVSEILFHKEKKQKKNNKTNGQIDNLKKYTKPSGKSSSQIDNQPTPDKLIKREANYIKNLHIDQAYERLRSVGLITDDKYQAWWCGTMHTLGVSFVMAQAEHCLTKREVKRPAGLFHHLINKAINKSQDPMMPRFKNTEL